MGFPIEFSKRTGDYDFLSGPINFAGNAAVVAVGGISLAYIANVALKALGFSKTATIIATAIPATFGAFAAAGTLAVVFGLGYMAFKFRPNF